MNDRNEAIRYVKLVFRGKDAALAADKLEYVLDGGVLQAELSETIGEDDLSAYLDECTEVTADVLSAMLKAEGAMPGGAKPG